MELPTAAPGGFQGVQGSCVDTSMRREVALEPWDWGWPCSVVLIFHYKSYDTVGLCIISLVVNRARART